MSVANRRTYSERKAHTPVEHDQYCQVVMAELKTESARHKATEGTPSERRFVGQYAMYKFDRLSGSPKNVLDMTQALCMNMRPLEPLRKGVYSSSQAQGCIFDLQDTPAIQIPIVSIGFPVAPCRMQGP